MKKIFQLFFKWKFIIFVSIAFTLSGCPLNVNLNVSTDKPITLVIDKPIDVQLGANVAVTQLPPVDVKLGANVAISQLPPVRVGIARTKKKK